MALIHSNAVFEQRSVPAVARLYFIIQAGEGKAGDRHTQRHAKEAVLCCLVSRVHPCFTHSTPHPWGCARGTGERDTQSSNILVLFPQLERHPVIERTELSTNHVLVYLEKVSIHLGRGRVRNPGAGIFGHTEPKTCLSEAPRL